MSRICAVIPTFNRERLVVECLRSILLQTRPVDDIIVVDDGSTDNTLEVLDKFRGRIRVVHQRNAGKAAALNTALRICDADYVWICDDDDVAVPDATAALAAALDKDVTLDFVYGDFLRFVDTPAGRKLFRPWHVIREEEDSTLIHFLEGCFTFQFAQLVRRSAFAQVGEFREDLLRSQDYEMVIRLVRHCRSAYVPKVIFHQRQHDGLRGTSTQRIAQDNLAERWMYYDKLIFLELRRSLCLAEVIPKFARSINDDNLSRRAALLQRACIFAGKDLWEAALDDLEVACSEAKSLPTSDEIRLALSVIRNPLVWNSLLTNTYLCKRLQGCARRNKYGEQIVTALISPLFHLTRRRIVQRQFGAALSQARFLIRILGLPLFAEKTVRSIKS